MRFYRFVRIGIPVLLCVAALCLLVSCGTAPGAAVPAPPSAAHATAGEETREILAIGPDGEVIGVTHNTTGEYTFPSDYPYWHSDSGDRVIYRAGETCVFASNAVVQGFSCEVFSQDGADLRWEDGAFSLTFHFYVYTDVCRILEEKADHFRVCGAICDRTGKTGAPDLSDGMFSPHIRYEGEILWGGKFARHYTATLENLSAACYTSPLAARLFLVVDGMDAPLQIGSAFRTEGNTVVPFDLAHALYCDRSAERDAEHPYLTADGDYSPCETLTPLLEVLSSVLYLDINGERVLDSLENGVYTSLYRCTYFDGVLTVELKSGADIPTWMLRDLYINGVRTYFEIYNGKIRLVV